MTEDLPLASNDIDVQLLDSAKSGDLDMVKVCIAFYYIFYIIMPPLTVSRCCQRLCVFMSRVRACLHPSIRRVDSVISIVCIEGLLPNLSIVHLDKDVLFRSWDQKLICSCHCIAKYAKMPFSGFMSTSNIPARREHSPLHNGLDLTPAAAVRLARRHARPINALGDYQPTLSITMICPVCIDGFSPNFCC